MPLMMVWPDSASVETRKDGSSAASLCSATPIFSWSALVLGSTAISMTGSGNSIFSRMTGFDGIAQRVAGAGILETDESDDVAGVGLRDLFAVVGVHENHAADALGLVAGRVEQRYALAELARINAAEGEDAVLVVHQLEGEHRQRLDRRLPSELVSSPVLTSMPLIEGRSSGEGR